MIVKLESLWIDLDKVAYIGINNKSGTITLSVGLAGIDHTLIIYHREAQKFLEEYEAACRLR